MTAHRNRLTLSLLCLSAVLISSCSQSDNDKVADAQSCLDSSTSDNALACMDKVEGLESEGAYLIRCSANFIYQQFTDPTRLTKIADSMQSSGGSGATALGLLAFTKTSGSSSALDLANATSTYCVASKSKGMILLAEMAVVGTAFTAAVGGTTITTDCDTSSPSYDPDTCKTTVQGAVCNASPETLGTAAQTAYAQSCVGSSQSNSSVCQQFATASSGTSDPAVIGANLQTQLNEGSCPP